MESTEFPFSVEERGQQPVDPDREPVSGSDPVYEETNWSGTHMRVGVLGSLDPTTRVVSTYLTPPREQVPTPSLNRLPLP